MSDCIDRNEVLRKIKDKCCCGAWDKMHICNAILDIPAVDVTPVRHERWQYKRTTDDGFAIVECTGCGDEAYAISYVVKSRSFCPNCGAKMDGGSNAPTP